MKVPEYITGFDISLMEQINNHKTKTLLDKGIPEEYHIFWEIVHTELRNNEVFITLNMTDEGADFFEEMFK